MIYYVVLCWSQSAIAPDSYALSCRLSFYIPTLMIVSVYISIYFGQPLLLEMYGIFEKY